MPTKNLILSLATNLDFSDYARFIQSARRSCPADTTDIVLMVEPTDPRYVELADRLQVKLIPISNFSRVVHRSVALKVAYRLWLLLLQAGAKLNLSGFAQVQRDATAAWIHPICSRHFFGRDYLEVNPNYRCVLLTDSRDVVFQSNPFDQVNPHVLNVFEHDPTLAIGLENIETEWTSEILGSSFLKKLNGKISVCCGTTMGSPSVILRYLALMEQNILTRTFKVIDQVIHNKLTYLDLPKSFVKVHSNTCGIVLTLGEMSDNAYEVVNQQVRLNDQVVSVLHQYDRVPSLKAMIEKLYDTSLALSN
ncbi:MAG: hypothetical protein KME10_16090 [Plectolyngbya sp. WJT66-NPBG17]|jgi:hypothetical protein|nr:hypothetical protein [Plectolyngbya sp. WJT66-NPBG17]MBW4527364.1 hypothetical protein [Phormidium tanganyikae FI6-MK23]